MVMASVPEPVHVLRGHFGEVQSLAFFSEDHLYSGDSNGDLRLWDLSSCRLAFSARLHDTHAGLLHLACVRSCGVLLSQGRDGCVRLWALGATAALERQQPVGEIRTESFNFCRCAVWAPGGAGNAGAGVPAPTNGQPTLQGLLVACAAHDPADVGIWRPAEAPSAVVHLRQGDSEPKHGMCMSLAFLPENPSSPAQQPAAAAAQPTPAPSPPESASNGNTDTCDDGSAGSEGQCPSDRTAACSRGAHGRSDITPGGAGGAGPSGGAGPEGTDPRFVVTGYEDGVVALWDLRRTARPLGSLRVHGEPVMCVALHPRHAAGRRGGGGAAACRAAAGKEDDERTASGAVSYDLISGSADDQISCCTVRPAAAQPLGMATQLRLREAGTADVAVRPDGKLFACGCWDGRARLYSLRRREPLAVLKYHRGQITALAFSPGTHTLATASRDTTVALWSVYSSSAQRQ